MTFSPSPPPLPPPPPPPTLRRPHIGSQIARRSLPPCYGSSVCPVVGHCPSPLMVGMMGAMANLEFADAMFGEHSAFARMRRECCATCEYAREAFEQAKESIDPDVSFEKGDVE